MKRIRKRFGIWAARLAGGEFHYPPRPDIGPERVGTLAQDGTPCRGELPRPTRPAGGKDPGVGEWR